jgi:phosphonate degradation associated HDIG domain protein
MKTAPGPDTADAFVETLLELLAERGRWLYDGGVSQLEHALQCAVLASADGAPVSLVVAALLHDVGHLLSDEPGRGSAGGDRDLRHEAVGARFLHRWFPAAVADPVALHVRAKRYLVTLDLGYADTLSEASRRSFVVQGALLGPEEVAAFRALPYATAAVALRRWDDRAKVPGLLTPPLAAFAPMVHAQVRRRP